MAWRGKDDVHIGGNCIGWQAVLVDINHSQMTPRLREDITQSMIAGVLNRGFAALCQQYLSGQPQGILGSECDQYFLRAGNDAAPGQCVPCNKLNQLRIILIVIISGQRGEVFLTQSL